jgi:hypothetical protein
MDWEEGKEIKARYFPDGGSFLTRSIRALPSMRYFV